MAKHLNDETPRQARDADRTGSPAGYTSPLAAIPVDAQAALELAEGHEQLTVTRVLDGLGALTDDERRDALATVSGKVAHALRLLTGGALAAALLAVVALVVGPAPQAAAMEGPEPDPAVVQVTVASQVVQVRVPVHTSSTISGLHCASVWGPGESGRDWVGGGCSVLPNFPVRITLDTRFTPLGRSYVAFTNDANPREAGVVALDTRRQSRFQTGTYTDRGDGTLAVRIPVQHYSPAAGTWAPSQSSPVRILEATRHGMRVRATLTTNRNGLAVGVVKLGAGLHLIQADRPIGATVTGTRGVLRFITVTNLRTTDID
jgi:hypothetical protein